MSNPRRPKGKPHRGAKAAKEARANPYHEEPNHRRRAHRLLTAIEHGAFASELFEKKDPPFVREVVLGVARRRATLDAVHAAFAKRDLATLDEPVIIAVRIGLYQMIFLDAVPVHAAVSESVGTLRLASQRTYANGVLRTIARESNRVPVQNDRGGASPRKRIERAGRTVTFFSRSVFSDPEQDLVQHLAAYHSHPEFLVKRWVDAFGADAAVAMMENDNVAAPLTLRPRRGRIDAETLARTLLEQGVKARIVDGPDGEVLDVPTATKASGADKVVTTKAFTSGLCSVQQLEQAAPVAALAVQPGEVVWDVCAAPGGKATQIAEQLEGSGGHVIATDSNAERVERLVENAERLGLTDTMTCATHDALGDDPVPGKPAAGFDAILVDAPCSNTAVLGRRPEARWRLTPETFSTLAAQQRALVEAARRHLKPGGRLIYSTCSHEPEENADHGFEPTDFPMVWRVNG